MGPIVRVCNVGIKNIKNVIDGSITTSSTFEAMRRADLIGLYGQNGSGKTALVEMFSVLKSLVDAKRLPETARCLLAYGQDAMELSLDFIVSNRFGQYFVRYQVALKAGQERLVVVDEKMSYRENEAKKRYKELLSKKSGVISVRSKDIKSLREESRVSVLVADRYASDNATSFIFRPELAKVMHEVLSDVEVELLTNISHDFNKNFHVIDHESSGWILASIMMPVSIHIQNMRGRLPYGLSEPMVLPPKAYDAICQVISQANIVLKTLVPGLQVIVNRIHEEKMDDGTDGVRFEFLSQKGGISLPLRCESAGILKIISILSTLIAVYNNANACVVIDELDSGIFEYLLGELLEVISQGGKGQLFFTSHNLRVLEVLPSQSLWFTTANPENRFVQLKGVRALSNARDMYLRAVQLGDHNEVLYSETSSYDIKKAFRNAGGPDA